VDSNADLTILEIAGRRIILVGTAHVSQESADLVREVIERERPDRVCVELDPQRYKALSEKSRWENLNLKQIIQRRQLPTLAVNLLLASYQKKIGGKLGVQPGQELLEATRVSEELGIPFDLCDREIRITMLRAWRLMSFWQRMKLMSGLLANLFVGEEISEEDLRNLRQQDMLSEVLKELAAVMPSLKKTLIDERDQYLAEKIRTAEGGSLIAVIGAGHVAGIQRILSEGEAVDLDPLTVVPPASPVLKWLGWGIPALILSSLGLLAWTKGGSVAGDNLIYWVLANGIPSMLGAALALAHPLTILSAFVAAPITSLTPVIGAGYVTAFIQAWVCPPRVKDFQSVIDDASLVRLWWKNRLLKVLLAFILPGFGSMIGTYIGGYKIFHDLVQ
jgi:pheromone shutdown-related protein TraB